MKTSKRPALIRQAVAHVLNKYDNGHGSFDIILMGYDSEFTSIDVLSSTDKSNICTITTDLNGDIVVITGTLYKWLLDLIQEKIHEYLRDIKGL